MSSVDQFVSPVEVAPLAIHQRMRGAAFVAMRQKRERTVLDRLSQSGAAKAMLPRVHGQDPELVFLNTAGGLTGGDRLSYDLALGPGAGAVATTQTAERAYRSLPDLPPAVLDINLEIGEGAHLAWLPQETILFDASALSRRTKITLAPGASCLACETILLGRVARGESLSQIRFRDWREISRGDIPLLIEPLALGAQDLADANSPARLNGMRAFSTITLVADDAEDRLDPLRRLLDTIAQEVEIAASAWDGRLVVRAMAQDGLPLRKVLTQVLRQLGRQELPRVWQM